MRQAREGRVIALRQWGQRQLNRQSDRSDLVIHLRRTRGKVSYEHKSKRNEPFTRTTTTDSTVRGRATADGTALVVHWEGNLFTKEYWARVPFEDVVRVAPFTVQEELWAGFQDLAILINSQVEAAVKDVEDVLPSAQAVARAEAERVATNLHVVVADMVMSATIDILSGIQRSWAGARLGGVGLAVAILETLTADERPLDELIAVPSDPAAIRAVVEAKQVAIERLRQTTVEIAQVSAHDHEAAPIGDEQLGRFMRWTTALADHGQAASELIEAVDRASIDLDAVADRLAPRWEGAVLGLIGAGGAVVGVEARAKLAEAMTSATATIAAARETNTDLGDLAAVTAELRRELAAKRDDIEAALARIGELAIEDTADIEQEIAVLEQVVGQSAATLAGIESLLAEVADDLADQARRDRDDDTLAALNRLRLTVATSRDERLLRSAVEQANATLARIETIGRSIEPVEGRFAQVTQLLSTFDGHRAAPSLSTRIAAISDEFASIGNQADTIADSLPELLKRVLALITTIRSRQQAVIEQHRRVFAATVGLAVATDRLVVEGARIDLARKELVARTPSDTSRALDPVAATAEVHRRLAGLVNADAAQAELAELLRNRIVDGAARLAILDPLTRAKLGAARRLSDDEVRFSAGPARRLVPTEAQASGPVERGAPWSGDALIDPAVFTDDGYTLAFRLRLRRPVSTTLFDGVVPVHVRRQSLVVGVPAGRAASAPTRMLRSGLRTRTINDVALVVDRDDHLVLWVNGLPVAHGLAPRPSPTSAADVIGTVIDSLANDDIELGDVRLLARPLSAEEVIASGANGPDPAEADLVAYLRPEALGPFGPAPSTRPGVPDDTVLIRTPRGDIVVADGLDQMPWDAEGLFVGRNAGVAFYGEPDHQGSAVESFVDLTAIDLMGVESLRVVSTRPSVDAKRWALEVRAADGTSALVAVDHGTSGALTTADDISAAALFDLATTGDRPSRQDRGFSIRSSYNEALLQLADAPGCVPGQSIEASLAEPGSLPSRRDSGSGRGSGSGNGDDSDDDGPSAVEIEWLATGPGGPRLVGPTVPTSIDLFYSLDPGGKVFTLLRWRDGSRRYRLVVLATRLCLVADDTEVVAISRPLEAGKSVGVRIEPAARTEIIRVANARRPTTRSASAGIALIDETGKSVGTWHRLAVNRPRSTPRARAARGEADAEIPFAGDRRIRVGPSTDPFHDRPGTGTAGGSLTGARPVVLPRAFTLSAWVKPVATTRRGTWTAFSMVDENGEPILRLRQNRSSDGPVVEYLGQPVPVGDRSRSTVLDAMPDDRWSHVAVRVGRQGRSVRLTVMIDGEQVVDRRVPALGSRSVRVTAGDRRCAVNHVIVWDTVVDDADLFRHLLRPSLADRPQPALAWRLDGDGDVDGVIRGQSGVAAVLTNDRRRIVTAPSHPLTDQLPERPRQSGEPVLIARVAGERYGRPSFRLAEIVDQRRRWLRWSPDDGFTTTRRVGEASEFALRAMVSDRLDLNSFGLWHRVYGAPSEEPAQLAAAYDYPPATGAIAGRERTWDDAMRRALDEQLADESQWVRSRAETIATASSLLATGWIDADLPLDDLEETREVIDEIDRLIGGRFTGLRFASVDGDGVRLADPQVADAEAATLSYWVSGDLESPSGSVVVHADADGRPWFSVSHLVAGGTDGGPAVVVAIGDDEVRFDVDIDAGWHHVAVIWRSRDGRVRLRIDGSRAIVGTAGAGVRLPTGSLIVGPSSAEAPDGRGFVGRVEQMAMRPGERTASSLLRERRDGLSSLSDGNGLVTEERSEPGSDQNWLLTERAGSDPVGTVRALQHHRLVTFAVPPIVERLERWEGLLSRAGSAGDGAVTALIEALGRKPHRQGLRVDDLHRALAAAGVRTTREAMEWDLAVWTHALTRFEPSTEITVRARHRAITAAGLEIRETGASGARRLGERLEPLAPAERVAAANELGWYLVDPGERPDALLSAGRADFARLTSGLSSHRDLAARNLGLEPMWQPLAEPAQVRRELIGEAIAAIERLDDPRPSPAEIKAEVHLDMLMLAPLLDGSDDDWVVNALRLGL